MLLVRRMWSPHLSQVMLIDKDLCSVIHWGSSGKRIVEVCFKHVTLRHDMLLVGAHLPHRAAPQEAFEEALWELENIFRKARGFKLVCIAGDWNTQPGDDRFGDLTALSSYYGFSLHLPPTDTWFRYGVSRRYDYMFFWSNNQLSFIPESAITECNLQAMTELGCDHGLVTSSFQFLTAPAKKPAAKPVKKKCFRWIVNGSIDECLPLLLSSMPHDDPINQWLVLKKLAQKVCKRRTGLRYRDPPFVKDLCKQRRETVDHIQRAWLVRSIYVCRAAAKRDWWKRLELQASCGNS